MREKSAWLIGSIDSSGCWVTVSIAQAKKLFGSVCRKKSCDSLGMDQPRLFREQRCVAVEEFVLHLCAWLTQTHLARPECCPHQLRRNRSWSKLIHIENQFSFEGISFMHTLKSSPHPVRQHSSSIEDFSTKFDVNSMEIQFFHTKNL